MNFSDEDVVKAIKCCNNNDVKLSCKDLKCPFQNLCQKDTKALGEASLALIMRNNSRIVKLQKENKKLHEICNRAIKSYKETRVEAMKELTKDIIQNVLPKYMYGKEETALRLGFAISERTKELAGEIWHP